MTIRYYTQDNDFTSIIDFFINQLSKQDNEQSKLIKTKIKVLYDHNFFKLFKQVITLLPIKDMKNDELSFFVKEKVFSHFITDDLSFEDENFDDYSKTFLIDYVNFNCNLKIYKISEKLLNNKKIPLNILETELFTLKDFIISENLSNLDYVLNSFNEYLKNSIEYENYENIFISWKIVDTINTHKYHLMNYLDLITLKLEEINITSKSNESNKKSNNYDLRMIDDKILINLYKELERNEFINIFETSCNQFIEVLKKDWNEHKSIIHLKMDNIQLNFFLINLNKLLKIKISLSKIEQAKNIYNKNGIIKAYSVSASYSESLSKGSEPKRIKEILSIFKKIN
ncbi:MAG: hypothetical protein KA210_04380 [Bacteroidia bacterium]|nr:hypothetical protein [Bacteroidia bacterium]